MEEILGLKLKNGNLAIDPSIPTCWTGFSATVRQPGGSISVRVGKAETGSDLPKYTVDGKPQTEELVAFPEDGSERIVEILL